MKTGINQWAFPADMPAPQAIDLAKRTGFEAFEVCIGDVGPVSLEATEEELTSIRRHADKAGIALNSVATSLGGKHPMCSPDAGVRETARDTFERLLQMTQWLGADTLLTVPGGVTAEIRYDVALEHALASIEALVPTAERLRVCLAIENVWNNFLLSPVEMRDFIDQCESDCVGSYFDVGNVVLYGYPEQWILILGSRIRMVHAKDFRRAVGTDSGFVMLLEGDVDWHAVMAACREIGYDNALIAEYGPYPQTLDTMLEHARTSLDTIVTM